MASYLKPRRGRKSTAETQNFILKRGEIFFEAPESGVGTGLGRIKIGDGTSRYTDLPYFYDYNEFVMDLSNTSVIFEETSISDNNVLFNKIVTGAKVNVITASTKNLIKNINTALNNLIASLKTVAFTNSYNDLDDKPFIPTIPGVVSKSANGLAPKLPNETTVTKFLRQDATWAVPPDTVYTANNGVGLTGNTFYNSGVRSVSINGNKLRVNTNGTNNDLTIPYATTAGSASAVAWSSVTGKPNFAAVATSGSYNDLTNKPTIPTVNNATLTIQKNGSNVATFTANSASNATANITVPTNNNQLTNGAGYITSSGSCNYANSAGAVAWGNVTGKPTFGTAAACDASKTDVSEGTVVQRTIGGGIEIGHYMLLHQNSSNPNGTSFLQCVRNQLFRICPNYSEQSRFSFYFGVDSDNPSELRWAIWGDSRDGSGQTKTYQINCGTPSNPWYAGYAVNGWVQTSDRYEKRDIEYFEDNFAKDFIMSLRPTKFRRINDNDDIHYGLIAQDVEESLESFGLTKSDFAGLSKDKYIKQEGEETDREYRYGLNYSEFIAPLIKTVQLQQEQIDSQQKMIEELKARLAKLEEK